MEDEASATSADGYRWNRAERDDTTCKLEGPTVSSVNRQVRRLVLSIDKQLLNTHLPS